MQFFKPVKVKGKVGVLISQGKSKSLVQFSDTLEECENSAIIIISVLAKIIKAIQLLFKPAHVPPFLYKKVGEESLLLLYFCVKVTNENGLSKYSEVGTWCSGYTSQGDQETAHGLAFYSTSKIKANNQLKEYLVKSKLI